MSKKGISPGLITAISGIAAGLLSKKSRDQSTPPGGGFARDLGVTAMLAAGGSELAQSQQLIDYSVYGLSDEYNALIHGIALIGGFILYAFGIGQKKEPNTKTHDGPTDPTISG